LAQRYDLGPQRSQGLVDILDRILDKGLVVAGDIRVHLANVELITIQIRLLVCSIDKADEIGLNWWRADPYLSADAAARPQLTGISDQLDRIEQRLGALEARGPQ
jgi:hypothetical protein